MLTYKYLAILLCAYECKKKYYAWETAKKATEKGKVLFPFVAKSIDCSSACFSTQLTLLRTDGPVAANAEKDANVCVQQTIYNCHCAPVIVT